MKETAFDETQNTIDKASASLIKNTPRANPTPTAKKGFSLMQNKTPLIFGLFAIIIIALLWVFLVFLPAQYKYSFNINGVDFVSNEYTPSEFFPKFKDNNSFVIVVDAPNNVVDAWTANSINLWLVALNADQKEAILLIKNINSSGVAGCITNDGNVLVSREINADDCSLLENDSQKARIFIKLSDSDKAVLFENKLVINSSGTKTISLVNYFVIKEMYANFDEILALVNEKINAIS